MSRGPTGRGPIVGLAAATAAAGSVALWLGLALEPAPSAPAPGSETPPPAATEDPGPADGLERASDVSARVADGAEMAPTVLADAPPPSPAIDRSRAQAEAERAVASLAAAIDPELFRAPAYEQQAAAIASDLASGAGALAADELAHVAADCGRSPRERVAAAAILRHAVRPDDSREGAALPEAALGALRSAWEGRGEDPVLAAAAVSALGAFGDSFDRRAMLADVARENASASLARTGLAAARGDDAVLELAGAAAAEASGPVAGVVAGALTSIAGASGPELSPDARARGAQILLAALANRPATDGASTAADPVRGRLLAALAALDPERAVEPLLGALRDGASDPALVQCAASALRTIPAASADLAAIAADARVDRGRRTAAAEAVLRSGSDDCASARSALESVRDSTGSPALARRAARALERADARREP
jgi:hypothetical protein